MASLPDRRAIMDAMRALKPGAGLRFELPDGQPARRDRYRMIAAAAHETLGVGAYRVLGARSGVRDGTVAIVKKVISNGR